LDSTNLAIWLTSVSSSTCVSPQSLRRVLDISSLRGATWSSSTYVHGPA
jgi:hypothetical protein